MDFGNLEQEHGDVVVRTLKLADLDRIARIDEAWSGRNRRQWFAGKLSRALRESDVNVSLGAEIGGMLVGAVLGSVAYGEFGIAEPVATLDTVLVDPGFTGRGVGAAMFDQMFKNLHALRIERVRTEVAWNDADLLGFLAREGFQPVPRLVLERPTG